MSVKYTVGLINYGVFFPEFGIFFFSLKHMRIYDGHVSQVHVASLKFKGY